MARRRKARWGLERHAETWFAGSGQATGAGTGNSARQSGTGMSTHTLCVCVCNSCCNLLTLGMAGISGANLNPGAQVFSELRRPIKMSYGIAIEQLGHRCV